MDVFFLSKLSSFHPLSISFNSFCFVRIKCFNCYLDSLNDGESNNYLDYAIGKCSYRARKMQNRLLF